MKRLKLLGKYSKSQKFRKVNTKKRNIFHKIIASKRGQTFFDGKRSFGYGGYRYDGRWIPVAKKIIQKFKLKNNSKILQINCEKGYLLHDLRLLNKTFNIHGVETSEYAKAKAHNKVRKNIKICKDYTNLKFENNYFDFVICLGAVSYHGLKDAIQLIREIKRVSKSKSFINFASFKTPKDYWLIRDWTVLGNCILHEREWKKLMKHLDYKGAYDFINVNSLNLKRV